MGYKASEYMYVHFTVLSILPIAFYDEMNKKFCRACVRACVCVIDPSLLGV